MKKDNPRTPLATTTTKLKKSNSGLKGKLRRVRSTEKKITSRINKEVRILFLSTMSMNIPITRRTKLRLRNKILLYQRYITVLSCEIQMVKLIQPNIYHNLAVCLGAQGKDCFHRDRAIGTALPEISYPKRYVEDIWE